MEEQGRESLFVRILQGKKRLIDPKPASGLPTPAGREGGLDSSLLLSPNSASFLELTQGTSHPIHYSCARASLGPKPITGGRGEPLREGRPPSGPLCPGTDCSSTQHTGFDILDGANVMNHSNSSNFRSLTAYYVPCVPMCCSCENTADGFCYHPAVQVRTRLHVELREVE